MAVVVTHAKVTTIVDDAGDDPQIVGPNDWNDNHTVTGLGTAAEADTGDFATAAQGAKADTATQPADLATALADYSTTAAIAAAYQPLDSDLTTWAGLTPSANAQSLVTAADYAAMRGLLDLEAGTDFYSISAANAAFAAASHTHTASQVTDFSTAADARVSAAIGVTVQAYDADLTAWAAVNPSSYSTTAQIAAAYQPLDSDLTSWAGVTRAAGFDAFAATPSSANLRALLSDETGTGIAYFVGGALGTPSSATLTNATGLPISTGVSGLGTNVAAFLATPSSANLRAALTDETGTGIAYFVGGALGTPSSATLTNATGLPVSGITASTSTALGVGSVELGHASDTTLSRGAAGFLAVEGKRVPSPASQASGDILYRGSTEWERLAKGTAGQLLAMNSGATAPEWKTNTLGSIVVTPEDYGAVGNGSTDDTTAIQAFFDAVTANGYRGIAGGNKTYRTTSTLTITGDYGSLQMRGAIIQPDAGVTPCLQLGTSGAIANRVDIDGLYISPASHTPADNAVGILLYDYANSTIQNTRSLNVDTAYLFQPPTGKRVAYNTFVNIYGNGFERNIYFNPQGTGFANENVFFGGRMQITTPTDILANVEIAATTAANHNRFYAMSLEGPSSGNDGPSSIICRGNENAFVDCRVEGTWSDVAIKVTGDRNYIRMMRNDSSVTNTGANNQVETWHSGVGVGVWRVLKASAVASSHTGSTTETTLASVTVPANTMGPNGVLRITYKGSYTNSANTKTLRVKFGSNTHRTITATTTATAIDEFYISNRNDVASQIGGQGNTTAVYGTTGNSIVTGTQNTAGDVTLTITGQLTNTGETIAIESYIVEILYQS